jgi:hypothetical protein
MHHAIVAKTKLVMSPLVDYLGFANQKSAIFPLKSSKPFLWIVRVGFFPGGQGGASDQARPLDVELEIEFLCVVGDKLTYKVHSSLKIIVVAVALSRRSTVKRANGACQLAQHGTDYRTPT